MYDTEHQDCRLLRLLGNTVAKGTVFGPQALALSEDGKRLAFIGPLEFTVTVLDTSSLDEVGAGWVMSSLGNQTQNFRGSGSRDYVMSTLTHIDTIGKYGSHACIW